MDGTMESNYCVRLLYGHRFVCVCISPQNIVQPCVLSALTVLTFWLPFCYRLVTVFLPFCYSFICVCKPMQNVFLPFASGPWAAYMQMCWRLGIRAKRLFTVCTTPTYSFLTVWFPFVVCPQNVCLLFATRTGPRYTRWTRKRISHWVKVHVVHTVG